MELLLLDYSILTCAHSVNLPIPMVLHFDNKKELVVPIHYIVCNIHITVSHRLVDSDAVGVLHSDRQHSEFDMTTIPIAFMLI